MTRTHETPPLGAAGLWNSICLPAISPENSPPTLDFQARFIAGRFNLRPGYARVIAELAFQNRRAA